MSTTKGDIQKLVTCLLFDIGNGLLQCLSLRQQSFWWRIGLAPSLSQAHSLRKSHL